MEKVIPEDKEEEKMKNGITNSLAVAAVGAVIAFGINQAEAVPNPVAGVIVDTVYDVRVLEPDRKLR